MRPFDRPAVQGRVERFRERYQVPGMAVGLAREGHPLLLEGFGWRNREAGLPVTPETVFGVASVTKSVTALAVMLLQEAGRLSVEDPVIRWLPEFRGPNPDWVRAMTIHHFLTHTSGLPGMQALFHARAASIARDPNRHRLGVVADPAAIRQIQTYQELMALMAETEYELLGPPGAWFNYSNEAYALLQGVIERAADRPFLEYMQEMVLKPLGMERSAFTTAELERLEPVTELYAPRVVEGRLEPFHAPGWWDVGAIYTNGSLKSTVPDLLRYLEIYRTGGRLGEVRLLSEASIRRMLTPHATTPTGRHYGYGLQVTPGYHGVTLVGHSGSIKGVSAHILLAPEAGVTAAVLCNMNGLTLEPLAMGLVNSALGLDWEVPRREYPPHPVEPEALPAYVGAYRNREGESARVELGEQGLVIWSGGLPYTARPIGPDGFLLEEPGSPVQFLRDEAGAVFALFIGSRLLPRERP
ncbi:MAG: serine hydrolase domain-containing protein [Bacillota bacterium]